MLSIGILTHNSPLTLKNTLESYKVSGLLEFSDDIVCLIQPSKNSESETNLCIEYGIKTINESKNTMMAGGIKRLVENSKYDYFMFLESDFRAIKDKNVVNTILNFGVELIKNNEFDVIRLRNLKNPGHPIHWNLQKREGLNYNNNTELYLCTHYLNNPHLHYPDFIELKYKNPLIYKMKSKNCVYTNNPNITSKQFYIKNIFPHITEGNHLEPEIFNFWEQNDFNIGISSGLFTHVRIDGHEGKNCYCCPTIYGGSSDRINCVCCVSPYLPNKFDNSNICDKLDDEIDENFMQHVYDNLQFKYFSNQ